MSDYEAGAISCINIKHALSMVATSAVNPYVVTGAFAFHKLDEDVQDDILAYVDLRVVAERENYQRLPDELRPANMPREYEHQYPTTRVTYSFVRHHRKDTLALGELTLTLSDCVDREWKGFECMKKDGLLLDSEKVYEAMDFKETWSGISKIRLPILYRTPVSRKPTPGTYTKSFLRSPRNLSRCDLSYICNLFRLAIIGIR